VNEEIAEQTLGSVTLSVAVTAHSEGRLLRPTLRSLSAALAILVAQSITCEMVIVLDNATNETRRVAELLETAGQVDFPVRIITCSHGDAGASRNAAAQNARGTFLAFCDGDDLLSSNYFAEALAMLSESNERLIVHPEQVISFGARSGIWKIPASESIDHRDLIRHNLWPSSSVSHRSTYLEIPYPRLVPGDGFGPEDWLWNIQTATQGILHRPVPGTFFFYRVREFGGVNNRHLRSILPAFDLDGLITALPVPAEPIATHISIQRPPLRRVLRRGYRMVRPIIRVVTIPIGQTRRERLYSWVMRVSRPLNPVETDPPAVVAALREAAELEPALSWTAHGFLNVGEWNPVADEYSSILIGLVNRLRGNARAIVAVPWVGVGGADLVSINYARAFVEDTRFEGRVSMLATYLPSRTLRHLVPQGVNFVQVPEEFREMPLELQRRLLAQVLLLVNPDVLLSVNCFDVTNVLHVYGSQLAISIRMYLTLFAFDRIGAGYPVNPITDDSQREFLDDIVGIITDNTVTAALVEEILALDDSKVRVHHQPALDPIPALNTATRSYSDEHFTQANPFKLVWPHRLDKEKRPDTLIEIADRLRERGMPIEIHVYGQQVLSTDSKTLMKSLSGAGIKYEGPYQGGLMSLPTHEYHALLLTSESEGLPLVLVQSMLLGLPVISTAVGGVTDIVRDNETGLLTEGPDDIEGFVRAIRHLMESLEDRQRIIRGAYDFAVAQHGWRTFTALVDELA
jgi:glycosyltransferase involved in cell wall biosynthesis